MGAEQQDMILSWGHLYLTYNEKCIDYPLKLSQIMKYLEGWPKKWGLKMNNLNGLMSNA